MSQVPELSYREIIRALQRGGWVVVRQSGSHIRLQKHLGERTLKLIVPAHIPVLRSTLSHIIKQAELDLDDFLKLL
jgi:predicted RNA binding protein YcfA (HicA-like mRNA interferase family)